MNDNVKNILEWILCGVIALVLALIIKYFLIMPTVVKSVSMQPNLVEGQRLILDKTQKTFQKALKRGDIVTFEAPTEKQLTEEDVQNGNIVAKYNNNVNGLIDWFMYYVLESTKTSYIKRVIGLPGEHIKIEDGKVYVNGYELKEDYLKDGITTGTRNLMDFIVPEGTVFLMGDNRPDSTDCRAFGCIPLEKIESKVWIRIWPLNVFGKVD